MNIMSVMHRSADSTAQVKMAEEVVCTSFADVFADVRRHEVQNAVHFVRRDTTKHFGSDGKYIITFVWRFQDNSPTTDSRSLLPER